MRKPLKTTLTRGTSGALAAALMLLLAGDGAQTAPPPGVGIDPFEVLDLQVKNNVLIALDTSGSMKWPSNIDNFSLGADDPVSRMFQAKDAIRQVVIANQTRVNFGLASYNVLDSQKTLVTTQDFDGDGRADGPFSYVSADAEAANFYINHLCPDGNTRDGFFCQIDNTLANYDGTNSSDIWRSFMNRNFNDDPYPVGCTPDAAAAPNVGELDPDLYSLALPANIRCRYYLQSRLIRNSVRFTWNRAQTNIANRLTATAGIACPPPPPGLLGYVATPPICMQFVDQGTGATSTFYYTSAIYQLQAGSSCGGGATLAPVAPCTGDNAPIVISKMDPELPVAANGTIPDLIPNTAPFLGDQTVIRGLRADQSTPMAGTLDFIRTAVPPAFPPLPPGLPQKNFVVLITDGDDTCASGDANTAAVLAADAAERLFDQGGFNPNPIIPPGSVGTDPQHRAETFVIAFAAAINPGRANVIAQGGSGGIINGASVDPATAVTGCKVGAACRNAFIAQNTQGIVDALSAALSQSSTSGEFSTNASVFDDVLEYVGTIPLPPPPFIGDPFDPLNPDTRYKAGAFRAYQTTLVMPNFQGRVKAFGAASPTTPIWEANAKLAGRLETDLATVDHSFVELHGGLNPTPPNFKPLAGAHIDRRIFTTQTNGISPARVMIWPPTSAVAPPDRITAGSLDNALGIGLLSTPLLTPADLRAAPFRACQGVAANLPPECTGTVLQQRQVLQKEAREMILAFTAGAAVRTDASSNPIRNAVTKELVYRSRPAIFPGTSLLAETTLAVPALVTVPSSRLPVAHTAEYQLYRDGPRNVSNGLAPGTCFGASCLDQGFGLRNPDKDGREDTPTGPGTLVRETQKPVMSVLYVGANDMLHAFRAGPCPTTATNCTVAPGGTPLPPARETGGEELWAFVPYDLLPKLRRRMTTQARDNHAFMIATSLRTGEIFVPGRFDISGVFNAGPFSIPETGVSYTGSWRKLLIVGRGIGSGGPGVTSGAPDPVAFPGAFGKYYTALDITAPGPFTEASLDTQLPIVYWSRGNPDRVSVENAANNNSAGDATAYLQMGQTWSVPSIARVNPAAGNGNNEFVVFTGSGYRDGANPAEGTRFYTLEPRTGNVIASVDVGDGAPASFTPDFDNALVADPITFAPESLLAGLNQPNPSGATTLAAYLGDIHGRIWKFAADTPGTSQLLKDLGRNQPVAVPGAMLNINGPKFFVATGYDARVPVPGTQFQVWGIADTGTLPGTTMPGFPIAFPDRFRGSVPPLSTYRSSTGEGTVFFVGTRFNPAGGNCVSTFDSVLFAIGTTTGGAAYDLDNSGTITGTDVSIIGAGQRVVGITVPPVEGPGGLAPPTTNPFDRLDQGVPVPGSGLPAPGTVAGGSLAQLDGPVKNSPVRTLISRPGSSVCR